MGRKYKQLSQNDRISMETLLNKMCIRDRYEIAGAWDFDKYAVESYRANVGDHVQKADIKELHQADIPQADVWALSLIHILSEK